jgi:hypothetical protein
MSSIAHLSPDQPLAPMLDRRVCSSSTMASTSMNTTLCYLVLAAPSVTYHLPPNTKPTPSFCLGFHISIIFINNISPPHFGSTHPSTRPAWFIASPAHLQPPHTRTAQPSRTQPGEDTPPQSNPTISLQVCSHSSSGRARFRSPSSARSRSLPSGFQISSRRIPRALSKRRKASYPDPTATLMPIMA